MAIPSTPLAAALVIAFGLSISSCQKIEQPRTELTQSQWRQIQPHIVDARPEPRYPLGLTFADEIEFIGLDIDGELQAGEEVTFTYYWRALKDISQDWKIFVHFDSQEDRFRQNLDHYPLGAAMNDVYRTYHWQEGQIIEDVQTFVIASDYPAGAAIPFVGLFRGDHRAPITSDDAPSDHRAVGPTLTIAGDEQAAADTPHHQLPHLEASDHAELTIDGRLDEEFWARLPTLSLQPMSGSTSLTTEIRTAFTNDSILIGATMEDGHIWSNLTQRDDDLWTEEVLEVFLAPGGADAPYFELQINPQGAIFDARFEEPLSGSGETRRDAIDEARSFTIEGLQSAVHIDGTLNDDSDQDRSWSVELVIPFAGLGLDNAPENGDQWRVNLYRIDRPTEDSTHAYGWSTRPRRNFHHIEDFGVWSFIVGDTRRPITADDRRQMVEELQQDLRRQLPEITTSPAPASSH